MRKPIGLVVAGLVTLAMCAVGAQAPEKAPAQGTEPKPAPAQPASPSGTNQLVPIEVQVVIARYRDDKKISSLPYTLSVNANGDRTNLRMGAEVAVPTTVFTPQGRTGRSAR